MLAKLTDGTHPFGSAVTRRSRPRGKLVPDLLAAEAGTVQAVNLDSPGVPGRDTLSTGRGPTRNRITVVGPLLDADGEEHLNVVFGAPASSTPGGGAWTRSGCCAAPARG